MLIKKENKVVGYRSQESELKESQYKRAERLRIESKQRLKRAEYLLDAWGRWENETYYGNSSLLNLEREQFNSEFTSSIPKGVKDDTRVCEVIKVFDQMRLKNQMRYVSLLKIVHVNRKENLSIKDVIHRLRCKGVEWVEFSSYNRAKKEFSNLL